MPIGNHYTFDRFMCVYSIIKMKYLSSLGASLLLVSCGGLAIFAPPEYKNPADFKTEEISDETAQGVDAIGAAGAEGRFKATFTGSEIQQLENDIRWAPEDPNVKFELGAKNKEEFKTWTKNYKKAIAESRQSGKPLLIWFSDSKGSAISNRLSDEVFSRSDFDAWVRKNYVTLLVDKAINEAKNNSEHVVRLKKYYEFMSERFSIKGTPEVIVVDVRGDVHARYRGYKKGQSDFYWGRLKVAREGAVLTYGAWREKMEAKGYRLWHALVGDKKIFARMVSQKGERIILVTPEGKKYTEDLVRFSRSDRDWVQRRNAAKAKQ